MCSVLERDGSGKTVCCSGKTGEEEREEGRKGKREGGIEGRGEEERKGEGRRDEGEDEGKGREGEGREPRGLISMPRSR